MTFWGANAATDPNGHESRRRSDGSSQGSASEPTVAVGRLEQ
jgi:hypothetical protein